MMLLSFISLMDRGILGILSPIILHDLHLSASQYGTAILVFSICYMFANPVWGLLMDRVGLFLTTAAAVVLWSIASGTHALLTGFLGLCFARALLGFGEGATFPSGLKTVTETLPAHQRSFGLGLAYSGGSLGALITPIVVVPLAGLWGWRAAFVLSAVIGFLWIALWFILRSGGIVGSATTRQSPSKTVSRRWNRDLFATAAIYGLGAAPVAYGLYTTPLYLNRVLHLPQSALGHLLWIPPAGWELGYLTWGRLADYRRKRALQSGRSAGREFSPLSIFILFAIGCTLLIAIPACAGLPHPVLLTMTLFFLVMFFSGGYVVIALAHGATTQSTENTGFLAGFSISGWSLATGLLMAQVGRMFDQNQITLTFWLAAGLPILGVIAWILLSSPSKKAELSF